MQINIVKIVPEQSVNSFSSLEISIEIINSFSQKLLIDWISTGIALEFRSIDGSKLLEVNEALRLSMLYSRGLREPLPVFIIPGNSSGFFTFNMAQYYYPLACGTYQIIPLIKNRDKILLEGKPQQITIEPAYLLQATHWFADPVFGSDNLLCIVKGPDGKTNNYLRHLGLNNPLSSFHNSILVDAPQNWTAYPSTPSFVQLERFEPGFDKRIIWYDSKQTISTAMFTNGVLSSRYTSVSIEHPFESICGSSYTADGKIYFFGIEKHPSGNKIAGYCIIGNTASRFFSVPVAPSFAMIQVHCVSDYIFIIQAGSTLRRLIYTYDNGLVENRELTVLNGKPKYLNCSVQADKICVACLQSDKKTLFLYQSAMLPHEPEEEKEPLSAVIPLAIEPGGSLNDVAFLFDNGGYPHIIYSTLKNRLIYRTPQNQFVRITKKTDPFRVKILPGDREGNVPFLGFYTKRAGYRYYRADIDFLQHFDSRVMI